MTRKIKRHKEFEISLQIKQDDFISPPREAQKNWLLNRAMKEFADDLIHLDNLAKKLIRGTDQTSFEDRTQKPLASQEIMEDWQIPVMKAMAEIVTENHGEVLEIGFGRGIASTYIQDGGVQSHTIIECNQSVVERFYQWQQQYCDRSIQLIQGKWQDVIDQLGQYDGIFFHTYPLNQEEFLAYVVQSTTFAEHFFPATASLLRKGGIFTYLSNETDSLSRAHQRLIFEYFTSFTLSIIQPLDIPDDSRDALWGDSMVVIKAVK